jgi:peroxiredoxin
VTDVSVPQAAPGTETQPLNLGSWTVESLQAPPPLKELKPGDIAPDFQVKTVDGSPLRLDEFRGKYVLLDFWATWCGPCRGETPHLKKVYDSFGANGKFAMIGLSLDEKAEAPKSYAETNHLPWHQGFLGDWKKATLPDQYGVSGIPSIFLIDPAGKIVEADLRGEDIAAAVSKALGKQN